MAAAENALKNGMHSYLIDPQFFQCVFFLYYRVSSYPKKFAEITPVH